MKLINGEKTDSISGTKIGETLLITLITGKIEKIILNQITKNGIEGFDVNLKSQPLTFYPFNNILKTVKFNQLEQGN